MTMRRTPEWYDAAIPIPVFIEPPLLTDAVAGPGCRATSGVRPACRLLTPIERERLLQLADAISPPYGGFARRNLAAEDLFRWIERWAEH